MKSICIAALLGCLCLPLAAHAENHGATLAWTASLSAAACTGTCSVVGYDVLEGPAAGQESSTPLNAAPLSVLTYTDDGATLNAYLGTTRCWQIRYTEVIGGLSLSAVSNETCFSFPAAPSAPGAPTVTVH